MLAGSRRLLRDGCIKGKKSQMSDEVGVVWSSRRDVMHAHGFHAQTLHTQASKGAASSRNPISEYEQY